LRCSSKAHPSLSLRRHSSGSAALLFPARVRPCHRGDRRSNELREGSRSSKGVSRSSRATG
jgi:hypothetical protein